MWSVIGHDDAVVALERSLEEDRVAHAYLLAGPAGVGKMTLALDLAKALNCIGPTSPCGECRPCRRIEGRQHPDVEIVGLGGLCDESEHDHRRDGSKDIKICQVRRLQRTVALRPFEGRTRVVIIDPADALNIYAADALLKTLEEPPGQVAIILLTTNDAALPETVVSRARRVMLSPLSINRVREELVGRGADLDRANLIARLSEGRMGWALDHVSDDSLLGERKRLLDRLESILAETRTRRMAFAAELAGRFAGDREVLYAELDLWQRWWRDLLLVGAGCDDLVTNVDRLSSLRLLAGSVPAAGIVEALLAVRDCRRHLEDNANARLALEVLTLRLPRPVVHEEAGPQ